MMTLVLVFCIAILVYEMIESGHRVEDFARRAQAPAPAPRAEEPSETVRTEQVLLFFGDATGRRLTSEPRAIAFSEYTARNCRAALDALIQGPREPRSHAPILSAATRIRALYLLEEGELVVDFSRELVTEHRPLRSALLEALMFYGIVQTLTQSALQGAQGPSVRTVRFLVEGAVPGASFPAHVDVSKPLVPDPRWVAPAGA